MPKVKVRSSLEHVSGDTVKVLSAADLPKGCCVLKNGLPCTYRMTHVAMKVESFIWLDDNGKQNVVIEGFCKSHRPRNVVGSVIELPTWLAKQVNGKQAGSRLRRMEQALTIYVSAEGGSVLHRMPREGFVPVYEGGNWMEDDSPTLCGRLLKVTIIPTPKERKELTECAKCAAAASSLVTSMSEKEEEL